ncbi:MAG: hypothetical protein LBG11_08950, partial [Bifidobacteriaceae bacterium]|nr:hypothetical protein [Bifidobacteriaceae bacterium]
RCRPVARPYPQWARPIKAAKAVARRLTTAPAPESPEQQARSDSLAWRPPAVIKGKLTSG